MDDARLALARVHRPAVDRQEIVLRIAHPHRTERNRTGHADITELKLIAVQVHKKDFTRLRTACELDKVALLLGRHLRSLERLDRLARAERRIGEVKDDRRILLGDRPAVLRVLLECDLLDDRAPGRELELHLIVLERHDLLGDGRFDGFQGLRGTSDARSTRNTRIARIARITSDPIDPI